MKDGLSHNNYEIILSDHILMLRNLVSDVDVGKRITMNLILIRILIIKQ